LEIVSLSTGRVTDPIDPVILSGVDCSLLFPIETKPLIDVTDELEYTAPDSATMFGKRLGQLGMSIAIPAHL